MGGGITQVVGLIAFCGCLEQLATVYVIDTFAPKRWIKALLALASVIRTSYTYPAISPIRTLFPLILCAFITYLYKHNRQVWITKWFYIGYVICSLAVLWNVEMGAGCIIGFTAYILVELWQTNPLISRKMSLAYLACFVFAIGSVLAAVIVVNIYNFLCGYYQLVFGSFFFPYSAGSWVTEDLRCNVPIGNHAWIYILVLFLGCSSWALYNTRLFHMEKDKMKKEAPLIAGISLTGIIVFAYYINEAHWGCMEIIHGIAICLSAIILNKFWSVMSNKNENATLESQLHRGIVVLALMIFSMLALQVVNDPIRISARYKDNAYNVDLLKGNVDMLAAEVPKDTYGVGQGINIIYHELGWENHAKYRDTTSISIGENGDDVIERLIQEMLLQDSFLVGSSWHIDSEICENVLSIDTSYKLQKTINIMGFEYEYYIKEKQN